MEIELSQKTIDAIAYKAALIIEKRLRSKEVLPELVSTAEAARILHIKPQRMRQIADRYPHVKTGASKQSPLLFYAKDLVR